MWAVQRREAAGGRDTTGKPVLTSSKILSFLSVFRFFIFPRHVTMGLGLLPPLLLILLPTLALADDKNFNPTQNIGTLGSTAIQSFACGSFDCLVIAQQNVSSGAFETILYMYDDADLIHRI